MSDQQKCITTWRGDTGKGKTKYAKSLIMGVSTDAAAQTLAAALASHTDCNLAKTGFIENTLGTDTPPGASADTGKKGTVYFRDSADLSVHSVTIPAPAAADIENVGFGDVYKAASVATITALIATATGKTLTGLFGTVEDDRS